MKKEKKMRTLKARKNSCCFNITSKSRKSIWLNKVPKKKQNDDLEQFFVNSSHRPNSQVAFLYLLSPCE